MVRENVYPPGSAPPKSLARIRKALKSVSTVKTAPEPGPLQHGLDKSERAEAFLGPELRQALNRRAKRRQRSKAERRLDVAVQVGISYGLLVGALGGIGISVITNTHTYINMFPAICVSVCVACGALVGYVLGRRESE